MAELIGGIAPYSGPNNHLVGTIEPDIIFGDPHTGGNFFNIREIGGALSSGRSGDDRLEGRGDGDILYGDAFEIKSIGLGGTDRLLGGTGNDTLIGDAEYMSGSARGGNDHLDGGSERYTLAGDAGNISGNARGGDDQLYGGSGSDQLIHGDACFIMSDSARGGHDRLYGGSGGDGLCGDANGMTDSAVGGNDQLHGGSGDDGLQGDSANGMSGSTVGGNDRLYGDTGDDIMVGDALFVSDSVRCGNDTLVGGSGNDQMAGDAADFLGFTGVRGTDRFVFAPGSGQDVIVDFQPGKDVIQISRGYGYDSFAELRDNITDDTDGNVVIHLNGATDQISVFGVTTAALHSGDFLLG